MFGAVRLKTNEFVFRQTALNQPLLAGFPRSLGASVYSNSLQPLNPSDFLKRSGCKKLR